MDIFEGLGPLEQGLNASWTRHNTILNNVANVDTPGFKASYVEFEDYYKKALEYEDGFELKKTRDTHMDIGGNTALSDVEARVILEEDTSIRMDGNNVDIDEQMSELAKNNIYYSLLTSKASGTINRLRVAIKETT